MWNQLAVPSVANRHRAEHFLWFRVPSSWFQLWTCLALAEGIAGLNSLENLIWVMMSGLWRCQGCEVLLEEQVWRYNTLNPISGPPSASHQNHCGLQTKQMQINIQRWAPHIIIGDTSGASRNFRLSLAARKRKKEWALLRTPHRFVQAMSYTKVAAEVGWVLGLKSSLLFMCQAMCPVVSKGDFF